MVIDLNTLRTLSAPTEAEKKTLANSLATQKPAFILKSDYLAILAFGGTIQSAYVPAKENILPIQMNPAAVRLDELKTHFGIASPKMTNAILLAKDSREITNADIIALIRLIQHIPNQRVLVTCGTYMLPLVAQALDMHFGNGKSDKIIALTGSWLPTTIEGSDVDCNIGGSVAALNAFALASKNGIVFAQFHGEIVMSEKLATFDLHPPEIQPQIARPFVEVR